MVEPFFARTAEPAGVILAGGRGERLGGAIKAGLEVGGMRLLDRVAAALGGCQPLLVAHGPHDPAQLRLPGGLVGIPDSPHAQAGPLAGLAAAIAWLNENAPSVDLLVSAAVDTPFLAPDYVRRLADGLGDASAAIASYGGQPYPTNAIWRLSAIGNLPGRIAGGTAPRSLLRLAREVGAVHIEWPEATDGDPFANINTPEDLKALTRRAARETPR